MYCYFPSYYISNLLYLIENLTSSNRNLPNNGLGIRGSFFSSSPFLWWKELKHTNSHTHAHTHTHSHVLPAILFQFAKWKVETLSRVSFSLYVSDWSPSFDLSFLSPFPHPMNHCVSLSWNNFLQQHFDLIHDFVSLLLYLSQTCQQALFHMLIQNVAYLLKVLQ